VRSLERLVGGLTSVDPYVRDSNNQPETVPLTDALADPVELLRAVRVVAAGDSLLSPRVTRRVVEAFARRAVPISPRTSLLADLTEREKEVVALVGNGLSNDEIAVKLFISPATARTHVSRAMSKLDARDRAQVVVFAYETGLVAPGRLDT